MITRVFFDISDDQNKALATAVAEAKKRPTSLLSPPKHPENVRLNRVSLTHDRDGTYAWRTTDENPELPAALEDLAANRAEIVVEIPIGPDTISLKPTTRADTSTGCRGTIEESDEELANGRKYHERLITVTGPSLKAAVAYLERVRRGTT